MKQAQVDNAPVIINQQDLRDLIDTKDEYESRLRLYSEVLKNVELFLTFWYENTTEFGKIRDDFNESDKVDAELRLKDGRVKIKINNPEDNNEKTTDSS